MEIAKTGKQDGKISSQRASKFGYCSAKESFESSGAQALPKEMLAQTTTAGRGLLLMNTNCPTTHSENASHFASLASFA